MKNIDKSTWGQGPWTKEPDFLKFNHKGLHCFIWRHPEFGHLCGYVQVSSTHPVYGMNYSLEIEVNDQVKVWMQKTDRKIAIGLGHMIDLMSQRMSFGSLFPVHGGLTFTGPGHHITGGSFSDWLIGFDCGHSSDMSPGIVASMQRFMPGYPSDVEHYKTMEYVKHEVETLAELLLSLDFTPTIVPESDEDEDEVPDISDKSNSSGGSGESSDVKASEVQTPVVEDLAKTVVMDNGTSVKLEKSGDKDPYSSDICNKPKEFQKLEDKLRFYCEVSECYH